MCLTVRPSAATFALLAATGWCLLGAPMVLSQQGPSEERNGHPTSNAARDASTRQGALREGRDAAARPRGDAADEPAVTPEREVAALAFARSHHPELADLLARLKKTNPPEYRRAVRELFQESERLARMAERSPDRHELALELWKVDSRVRLLAARMTMSEDPALEAELKAALHERLELRLRQLQSERERLAARAAKIDETISDIELDREGRVLRELQRIRRGLRPAAPR